MNVIRHMVVHGRVQGVGYRAFVEHAAHSHRVEGWVRNRRDGSVEAVLSGAVEKVEAVVTACRRGPYSARVDVLHQWDGDATDLAPRRPGEAFSVLPTA